MTIDANDVERAVQRAGVLRRVGYNAYPAVAGKRIEPTLREIARGSGVDVFVESENPDGPVVVAVSPSREPKAMPILGGMGKRLFDVTLTLLTAPATLLLGAAMAAILAVELRGNPFFVQDRVGLHGRPFRMYKLRTMRHVFPGEAPPTT